MTSLFPYARRLMFVKMGNAPRHYTDNFFLPLARLFLMTLAPPGVLILVKNPWVLLRFLL